MNVSKNVERHSSTQYNLTAIPLPKEEENAEWTEDPAPTKENLNNPWQKFMLHARIEENHAWIFMGFILGYVVRSIPLWFS